MATSFESLTESALNTAAMVCFATGDEPAGAALIVGSFFITLLWPNQNGVIPTQFKPVDEGDLAALKTWMGGEVALVAQNIEIDTSTFHSVHETNMYLTMYSQLTKVKAQQNTVGGEAVYEFVQDSTTATFFTSANSYFIWLGNKNAAYNLALDDLAPITLTSRNDQGILTPLQVANRRTQTTGLYCLAGTLIMSYLKLCVTWEWGNEVLGSRAWKDYVIALAAWNMNPQAYRDAHPLLAPVKPAKSTALPLWQDWRTEAGCPLDELRAQLDGPIGLIAYSETGIAAGGGQPATKGLYTEMTANWADRKQKVASRMKDFSMQQATGSNPDGSSASGYVGYDSRTKKSTGVGPSDLAGEMNAAMMGSAILYEWEHWSQLYALKGVKEDDLTNFGKVIETWKQIRDSVDFIHHVVADGDMLIDIARTYYNGDGSQSTRIFDFNRDILTSPNVLATGQRLKIPGILWTWNPVQQ